MTGISENAKNGNLPEFGEAISTASKALCGFTEAAAQVTLPPHHTPTSLPPGPCSLQAGVCGTSCFQGLGFSSLKG